MKSQVACCGIHCSLAHSQNIRHRFCVDSSWRPVALLDCLQALALLGGIRSTHGNGNQFLNLSYKRFENLRFAIRTIQKDELSITIITLHFAQQNIHQSQQSRTGGFQSRWDSR